MYIVNGNRLETNDDVYRFFGDNIDEIFFDLYMRERYGDVEICGHSVSAIYALKEADYTAYRSDFNDWKDAQCREIDSQVIRMSDGDTLMFFGIKIECSLYEVITNSKDSEISFANLDEAKEYYIERAYKGALEPLFIDYIEELKTSESLEELVEVLNAYSDDCGDGSTFDLVEI